MNRITDFKKNFVDLINEIADGRIDRREAYTSFLVYSIKKLNLSCLLKSDMRRINELNRRKGSSNIDEEDLDKLFDIMVDALECNPDQDFLGRVYEQLNLTSGRIGQFLTPYNVSKLMAEMNMFSLETSVADEIKTVADPTCGTGGMLIAAVNVLKEKHQNIGNYIMYAQDIDWTMAMSCYVQLALHGAAGMVVVGNSLDLNTVPSHLMDEGNAWILPMTYIYHPELLNETKTKSPTKKQQTIKKNREDYVR